MTIEHQLTFFGGHLNCKSSADASLTARAYKIVKPWSCEELDNLRS